MRARWNTIMIRSSCDFKEDSDMEILNRINAELDEIAEKLEEIGKID